MSHYTNYDQGQTPFGNDYGNSASYSRVNAGNDLGDDYQYQAPVPKDVKNIIWFASGILLVLGSLMAFFGEVTDWEVPNCLQLLFLALIGLVVAIVDAPTSFETFLFVKEKQRTLTKYCAAVFRVTGKGLTLAFAGSVLWTSLFTNVENMALLSFGGIFSLPVVIVGIVTFVFGMWKSFQLHHACKIFVNNGVPLDTYWMRVAERGEFINKKGFHSMFLENSPHARFDEHDLTMVFNALSGKGPANSITKSDVEGWLKDSSWTFL